LIAAIVLAAGSSTRMGRAKQLLPLGSGTVLSTVVSRLLGTPLDRVVVVLGHEAERIRREAGLPADPRVETVVNTDWLEGMASSLRCGVRACSETEAIVVALGDQPAIDSKVVGQLVNAFLGGAPLAVPVQGEKRGHPVLFGRTLFPSLLALSGDMGARDVVERHWGAAARIEAAPLRDLDTEEDYRSFLT
jgi:molybdenum cofactor cytidylyltransferase